MKARWLVWLGMICITLTILPVSAAYGEEQAAHAVPEAGSQNGGSQGLPAPRVAEGEGKDIAVERARDRAKVMHDIYAATLEVLHDRYFHRDRAIIPARVMHDVFDEIQRHSKTEARWISASMKPMSIDHEPSGEFEQRAAREIAAGKEAVEIVQAGYYRRAGAIPLGDGCIACHGGFFRPSTKKPQFAGLVISVPLGEEAPPASSVPKSGE